MAHDTDDQTAPEAWESFGIAINAMGRQDLRWADTFLRALELRKIEARAKSEPPRTRNDILDAAGTPSAQWWSKYRAFCESGSRPPDSWGAWLDCNIKVALAPTLHNLTSYLGEERKQFAARSRSRRRQDTTWSDVEVLAWFASGGRELVTSVRDFGHQDKDLAMEARAAGLRYIQLNVARDQCRCGSKRPLLPIGTLEGCSCTKFAWDTMVASLKQGLLAAELVNDGGKSRLVLPGEFRTAELNVLSGTFRLLQESGELVFEQADVQAQLNLDARFSNSEIEEWIDAHPQYRNVKEARKPFMKDPRAKGLSSTFEKIWQGKFKRARGHPKKISVSI